jgi:DivIVA domain-containing protein
MAFRVVAWTVIGLGALRGAQGMHRLLIGWHRPEMTGPSAWEEAWPDLQESLAAVACGLALLGVLESGAGAFSRLADVSVFAFAGWELTSRLRSVRKGRPEGRIGESPSKPDTSARRERGYPRALPLPAEGASAGELAEWVDGKIFSTTRLRPGYDEEEVDDFLDTIRDTFLGVREAPLTPGEVRSVQFTRTRLRPGYVEEDVDTFLEQAGARLAP